MILQHNNVIRREENPAKINTLIAAGFIVVEEEREPEIPAPKVPKDLTKAELLDLAKAAGVKDAARMTKAELFTVLFGGEIND